MDVEILHAQKGDKKKKLNTPEEKEEFVTIQIRKGTNLFLERGKKTYKIKGYDPKTDSLHVIAEKADGTQKVVTTRAGKAKVAAIPPVAGGL